MRRYIINVDETVTWILVHDEAVCRWHVKKHESQVRVQGNQARARGNQKRRTKLTFDAFEQRDEAEPLTTRFAAAVRAAGQDI